MRRPAASPDLVAGRALARALVAALLALAAVPAAANGPTPAGVAAVRAAFTGPAAQGEERVLFIGNSFTREYDVPALVVAIAAAEGARLGAGMIAREGAMLGDHAADPETAALVRDLDIDVLVLQDHSAVALSPQVAGASRAAIARLVGLTDARIVLVATWPRAEGHAFYDREGAPEGPDEMNRRTASHYADLAEATGARVAGVGHAFLAVGAARPEARLYAPDGYHASAEGARLAASVIAAAILSRSAPRIDDRAALD